MSAVRGVEILDGVAGEGLGEKTIKSDLKSAKGSDGYLGLSERREEHAKAGACLARSWKC